MQGARQVTVGEILGRWRWRSDPKVAAGETTITIYTPKVGAGERRELERLLLQNQDTANSVCVISILEAGNAVEIYRETLTSAAVWYPIQLELSLFEGECLRYYFSSCTAADDLRIREAGQVREIGEWIDGTWHWELAAGYGIQIPEGD